MKHNKFLVQQIEGRLTADPQVKETSTGKIVMLFSLAYDGPYKTDKDGSHTSFVQVEVWEKTAEMFSVLLKKGMKILVSGLYVQNRWEDATGKRKSNFKFSASNILITDLKYRPVNQIEKTATVA